MDNRGTAGAELALILPMLLVLLFGGLEAGHFIWTQHKLTDGVRDGARYAARLDINELCDGPNVVMSTATEDKIKLLTRTGQVSDTSALAKVYGWSDDEILVTISCQDFVSTGIYTELNGEGPIVTVSTGSVAYPSLLQRLGFLDGTIQLSAKANSAVTGV